MNNIRRTGQDDTSNNQDDEIRSLIQQFSRTAFCATPFDLASLEDTLGRVYQRLGRKCPEIVMFDSPWQLAAAVTCCEAFSDIEFPWHRAFPSIRRPPAEKVRRKYRLDKEIRNHIERVVGAFRTVRALQFDFTPLADQIEREFNQIGQYFLSVSLPLSVFAEYDDCSQFNDSHYRSLRNTIAALKDEAGLVEPFSELAWYPLGDFNLDGQFSQLCWLFVATRRSRQLELPRIAQQLASIPSDLDAQIDELLALSKYLFYCRLFDEVCAVAHAPVRFDVDDRHRLHNEGAPAVLYLDGFRYYFWHGVRVEKLVIETPHMISKEMIDDYENVELRRILLDRYGWQRYMEESNATVLQHVPELGTLYELPLEDDENLLMVEVINSTAEPDGSRKKYMLRVPPTMRSVREAVAWGFGLTEDEYHPDIES